jgi:hypothetical protein
VGAGVDGMAAEVDGMVVQVVVDKGTYFTYITIKSLLLLATIIKMEIITDGCGPTRTNKSMKDDINQVVLQEDLVRCA